MNDHLIRTRPTHAPTVTRPVVRVSGTFPFIGELIRTRSEPAAREGKRVATFIGLLVVVFSTIVWPAAAPARSRVARYVFLVTPKWWGWCPNSTITKVSWANGNVSSGGNGSDDIVYAKVNLNQHNIIVMAAQCSRNVPREMSYSIRPTRNGPAWYFGYREGASHN